MAVAASLCSCDKGKGLGHVGAYEALMSQVSECDTVGFSRTVCRLRSLRVEQPDDSFVSPQNDADILSAWYFCQQRTKDSTLAYAQRVLDALETARASSSPEGIRLRADMEYVMGAAFYEAKMVDSCYHHLQRSLDAAREVKYAHRIVKISELLAQAGRDIHDWQGCLSQLRKAEVAIAKASLAEIPYACRMVSLSECAGVAIDLCDVTLADRLLVKASQIYDKVTDRAKILYLRQLVRLRFFLCQYSQASTAMNKLEMLIGKTGLRVFLSDAMAFQGLARCRMGELEWADQYSKKIDTELLSKDGKLTYALLRGEVFTLQHDLHAAKTMLFDSIPASADLTPYDLSLVNESRRTFWVVQGRYEEAYAILNTERQRGIDLHNDVFSFNDRQREQDLAEGSNLRGGRDESHERRMSFLILLHVAAVFIIGSIATVVIRLRSKREAKATVLYNNKLQDELNQKVDELKQQAQTLEATNSRISDSITYAQHIQQSISPSPEALNSYPISGAFVFQSPLDIVSGDFLWFTQKGDKLIVCCADCTGHGVPGAFLSMIAATILNDICDHSPEDSTDPGVMLEMLDHSLIENLAHNRGEGAAAKDGLDAGIAVLDMKTHVLKIAAARRPIVFFQGNTLHTVRGTKRSVGDLDPKLRKRKFETTTAQLQTGDLLYMYTDGYSDQFGGQNGEKMKNSRIERFLESIHKDSMDEQNLTIQEIFVQWKGDLPQTDDVLFVGIRV